VFHKQRSCSSFCRRHSITQLVSSIQTSNLHFKDKFEAPLQIKRNHLVSHQQTFTKSYNSHPHLSPSTHQCHFFCLPSHFSTNSYSHPFLCQYSPPYVATHTKKYHTIFFFHFLMDYHRPTP